jgi:ribosomal protein S18 acetylase RimI-like enzyme
MTADLPAWRLAVAAEDDAIVELCLGLFREDPSPRDPGPAQIRRTLATYRAEPVRGRALVLATADGALVGYAFLSSFWSNELGGEVCVIDELYVGPTARGQGHGSSLLTLLAEQPGALWPAGAVALELETTAGNHRARALYQRLGFGSKNAPLRRLLPPS